MPGLIQQNSLSKDKGQNEAGLTLSGWGKFTIELTIHLKPGLSNYKFKTNHELCFEEEGKVNIIRIPINKRNFDNQINNI